MKRTYMLTVRGKQKEWLFNVEVDPQYIEEWRADGVEIDGPLLYSIPAWAVDLGLTRVWLFVSDVFNFRNPFKS